jgi:hypothetical protein
MGLDFAIDELYATGWSVLDPAGCLRHDDGRSYPAVPRVQQEFASAGFDFSLRHVQLFDCYRAEWRDGSGSAAGAVVGRSEAEAAVYALSQLRRRLVPAGS